MNFGCVYVLGNRAMPNIYKIGSTSHDVLARARELSAPTGVPMPFQALLWIQASYARRVEHELHRHLSDYRLTPEREFFYFELDSMPWLFGLFRNHPQAFSFTAAMPPPSVDVNPWASTAGEYPTLPAQVPPGFYREGELG